MHKGKASRPSVKLITVMQARKLLGRGCERFLYNVVEIGTAESSLEDILEVREFPDVFSDEISGMPPQREVEFCINLIPGATKSLRHPIE